MATVQKFEDLEVWQLSRQLCNLIGKIIDEGNFQNNYRIIGQIEGSSGSIMDNVAEGFERGTKAEFIQFLGYAKGSCGEFRSQLYRALDRNYISKIQFEELVDLAKMISSKIQVFIKYLQNTSIEGVRKKKNQL
ncbi:MAG: four helix bundle protein [Sphingobacteriia bacterium]|nr:four helix bundle protein [Sphingobacteriia bacterium]